MRAGVRRVALALALATAALAAPVAAQPDPDPDPEPPEPPTAFAAAAEAARDCAPDAVAALIAVLPLASSPDEAANALFTTARKCDTVARDPVAELALHQRILRDYPDSRAAFGSARKLPELTALIGTDGAGADAARRFAALKARKPVDDAALAEADALAHAPWPGAGEAGLWRASRLRELGRLGPAAAAFDDVVARFPDTPAALRAAVGAAAVAIYANRFDDAQRRIAALPATDPSDRAVRDDLADQLSDRQWRIAWYVRSWIVLIASLVFLLGSLAHATRSLRGSLRALVPPPEVLFAAPVLALIIGVATTTYVPIIPPVITISIGGLVLAWLSGAGLVAARRAGRPMRARSLAHLATTALAVTALVYIAVTRSDLLDMIIETVQFGPET